MSSSAWKQGLGVRYGMGPGQCVVGDSALRVQGWGVAASDLGPSVEGLRG